VRNVWKGLTVGAFAGAGVGIVLDAFRKAGEVSARAATEVSSRTKTGATHLADLVEEKIDDWDVKDKLDSAKKGVGGAVGKGIDAVKDTVDDWDVKDKLDSAKEGVGEAVGKGIDVVKDTVDDWDVKDKLDSAKEGVEHAIDKGRVALKRK
jgi:hypothetical protein